MSHLINRRKFLFLTATGVVGIYSLSGCYEKNQARFRFFSEPEASVIEAICQQIIPNDNDPGAKEANVLYFIDKQLTGYYSKYQDIYRKGIQGVEETAMIMFKNSFTALKAGEQIQLLSMLESGKAQGKLWEKTSSSEFFSLVRNHTMQGFYGHPKHGGNKNYVSFRMLKLDYPQIIGQNRYENPNK